MSTPPVPKSVRRETVGPQLYRKPWCENPGGNPGENTFGGTEKLVRIDGEKTVGRAEMEVKKVGVGAGGTQVKKVTQRTSRLVSLFFYTLS